MLVNCCRLSIPNCGNWPLPRWPMKKQAIRSTEQRWFTKHFFGWRETSRLIRENIFLALRQRPCGGFSSNTPEPKRAKNAEAIRFGSKCRSINWHSRLKTRNDWNSWTIPCRVSKKSNLSKPSWSSSDILQGFEFTRLLIFWAFQPRPPIDTGPMPKPGFKRT